MGALDQFLGHKKIIEDCIERIDIKRQHTIFTTEDTPKILIDLLIDLNKLTSEDSRFNLIFSGDQSTLNQVVESIASQYPEFNFDYINIVLGPTKPSLFHEVFIRTLSAVTDDNNLNAEKKMVDLILDINTNLNPDFSLSIFNMHVIDTLRCEINLGKYLNIAIWSIVRGANIIDFYKEKFAATGKKISQYGKDESTKMLDNMLSYDPNQVTEEG
ncbi:MAG: hypothetical protein ABI721_00505 [Candidatus Dojkabacteria bacterium]